MPLGCVKAFLFASSVLAAGMPSAATESIDLLKAPVVFRGSSFKAVPQGLKTVTDNYYTAISDGDEATFWTPLEGKGPHFIEMIWNHPVRLSSVRWKAADVKKAGLSRWSGGQWVPMASVEGDTGRAAFPEASSDRWRLSIDAFSGMPKLFDLKLFGPKQYILPGVVSSDRAKGRVVVSDVTLPTKVFRPGDEVSIAFRVTNVIGSVSYGMMVELSDRAALKELRNWRSDFGGASDFVSRRWAARPDADGWVRLDLELPPWTPNGRNDILVFAVADEGRIVETEERLLGSITVERPDFPPELESVRDVRVGENDLGQQGFVINGKWHPAFFNRYYGSQSPEMLAATARTGLKILYWQNREGLPCNERELQEHIEWFDRRIRLALRVNPQNYFILSQKIKAMANWKKLHPEELMRLDNGKVNPGDVVSFGSDLYLKESEEYVRRLIRFVKRQPYADKVIGYHLWTCTRNDAFIGGLVYDNGGDRKKFHHGDYHPGALRLFREFLRRKYGGDLSALRKAWHDDKVTFEDAFVPAAAISREDFAGSTLRDPVRSRPAIDYLEFFPTMLSRYLRKTAEVIKRETDGRALVFAHYGSVKISLCATGSEQLQCNNNDFEEVLEDPNIDAYIQAQPYVGREAGNPVVCFLPIKSLNLHKKLFLFDHDHRTVGSGAHDYGRHRSQYETASVYARDYGFLWAENAGAWISDMSYASWWKYEEERLPWYVMPQVYRSIHDTLAELRTVRAPRRSVAEIAVVLNLNSPRYEDALRMSPNYRGLVQEMITREGLPLLGAPHDVILMGDLRNPALPDYKLYLFPNPTYLTSEDAAAVEGLKRGGKTLMWFYAPGYQTEDGPSLASVRRVSGFDLKVKSNVREIPELVYEAGSVLSQGLTGRKLAISSDPRIVRISPPVISPIFYADDAKARTVGRYADGLVAYAVKDFGSWKSVWCGVPNFKLADLVNLAKFAGVHLYARAPVVLSVDNGMMMLHNGYESPRTVDVSLPKPMRVSDLRTGNPLGEGREVKVSLGMPETRLLRLEEIR